MRTLRSLQRLAARFLPEPVKAALRGRRYGYRRAAVSLPHRLTRAPDGALLLEVEGLSPLVIAEPMLEGFRFHLESNGESTEELHAFIRHARAGDGVLFDVGANQGVFSLAYCAARPGNRAVAFDAAAEPLSDLRGVLGENGFTERIHIHQAWLGSKPGTARGSIDASGFFNTTLEDRSREVVQTTIDGFAASTGLRPTVLKLDVEGAEIDVLQGAARTLHEDRPLLFVELHADLLELKGQSAEQFLDILAGAGYRLETLLGRPLSTGSVARTTAALLRFVARG